MFTGVKNHLKVIANDRRSLIGLGVAYEIGDKFVVYLTPENAMLLKRDVVHFQSGIMRSITDDF
jgi:hypothetical protein